MFDKYMYRIESNGSFVAGYSLSRKKGDNHSVFLFTSLRIIRVLSGSALWKIGKKTRKILKNDIIAVNNTEPRQFIKILSEPFEYEIFAFSPFVFGNESSCLSLFYSRTESFDPVITHTFSELKELNILLDILKHKIRTQNSSAVSGLLTAISAIVLENIKQNFSYMLVKNSDSKNHAAKIVISAIEYINQNISEETDVTLLAKNAGVSRGYFSKIFHKYTGTTPASFLNQCRINNVISLIESEKINILDAAFMSGFSSASGFYKTFTNICGMSPTRFLREKEKHELSHV